MATTISYTGPTQTVRVALDTIALLSEEVTIAQQYRHVRAHFLNSSGVAESGKVATSGTDGTAIGNNMEPVPAGCTWWEDLPFGNKDAVLFLAADSGGAFAHVTVTTGGR
jgi:hypothetical protein